MKCPNCDIELIHRPIDGQDSLHCPVCPFIHFPNMGKADYLYAALSVDIQGNEGIVASAQFGMPMPVISTHKHLVEGLVTQEFKDSMISSGHDCVIAKFKRVKGDD